MNLALGYGTEHGDREGGKGRKGAGRRQKECKRCACVFRYVNHGELQGEEGEHEWIRKWLVKGWYKPTLGLERVNRETEGMKESYSLILEGKWKEKKREWSRSILLFGRLKSTLRQAMSQQVIMLHFSDEDKFCGTEESALHSYLSLEGNSNTYSRTNSDWSILTKTYHELFVIMKSSSWKSDQ